MVVGSKRRNKTERVQPREGGCHGSSDQVPAALKVAGSLALTRGLTYDE